MPLALENKVFALKPGKVAGPLPSNYGFHVVRVLAKRPAMELTLAQAAEEIQRLLEEGDHGLLNGGGHTGRGQGLVRSQL